MTESRLQKVQQSTEQLISETVAALCSTRTKGQAADLLGIDESTLYKRLQNHPEIGKAIAEIPKLALVKLKSASYKAAGVLVDSLENKRNQLSAAESILDRTGLGKQKDDPTSLTQINIYQELSDEQLNDIIRSKARALGIVGSDAGNEPAETGQPT